MRLLKTTIILLLCCCSAYAELFYDDMMRPVQVNHPLSRIISLAPSVTETIFALGLEKQIVGVTSYCNYPPEAARKDKVGSFSNPSLEIIVASRPELIVASFDGNDKSKVDKLVALGIPVYIQRADNIEETLESIERLGAAVGKKKEASELVKLMRDKQKLLAERIKGLEQPKIFFEIGTSLWSVSNATFIGDLIKHAGAVNVVADLPSRYARVNIETLIDRQPEIIIISSMANQEKLPELKTAWQKWPSIPAVKNNQVHIIQSDIVNRAGPRIIDALEQIINYIH